MRPFCPSLSNQIQNQGGYNPLLQQGLLVNPHQNPLNFNPQSQISPILHGLNPQFQNTLPINSHGNHTGMPVAQNYHLGALPQNPATQNLNQALALLLQNLQQFQGQLNLFQSTNLAAQLQQGGLPWAHNPIQNLNQIMGLLNAQLGSQNPMLQGNQIMQLQCPQNSTSSTQIGSLNLPPSSHPPMAYPSSLNSGIVGNPHFTQNNSNSSFRNQMVSIEAMQCKTKDPHASNTPSTMGERSTIGTPAATKMQTHWNMKNLQPSAPQHPQVNHVEARSENYANRNLTRNFHGFGKREPSHNRFQKPQFHHARNAQGNTRPFTRNGGRGQHKRNEIKQHSTNSAEEVLIVRQRPLSVKYSENEIHQWREARKKNFPTRAKKEKKFGSSISEDVDADAKLLRQQLKEVLAKQEELGVEVAEIPPGYLSEAEDESLKKVNERKAMGVDGRFPYKGNNKRGRHGRDKWHAKRPKVRKEAPTACSPVVKREPSLLQKLLSADINIDKSRLLQVFRFMTLNEFFDILPDKPLEFPSITVRDGAGSGSEIGSGRNPSQDGVNSAAIGVVKNEMIEQNDDQKGPSAVDEVEIGSTEGDNDSISDKEEVAYQHPVGMEDLIFEKSEEGEITE